MAYVKHEWEYDELITDEKLNHMEDGIADNDQDLADANIAIGELNDAVEDLQTADENLQADVDAAFAHDTASGSIASFPDGAKNMPMAVKVGIEPVQDLHGYENPWPAGGGKNKLKYPYYNSSKTQNGITFTDNGDGSVTVQGTATAQVDFSLVSSAGPAAVSNGDYKWVLTGSASVSGVYLHMKGDSEASYINTNVGATNPVTISGGVISAGGIRIISGTSITSAIRLYPMLVRATETDTTFSPYSNISPISGWDGANLTRTGKNAWSLGDISTTETGIPFSLPAGTYTLSCTASVNSASFAVRFFYNDTDSVAVGLSNTYQYKNTVTLEHDVVKINRSATGGTATNVQLELGSTATAYEPYQSTTIPISFGSAGTVYGGSYDTQSGVLTVDKVTQVFNSFTNAQRENNGFRTNQTVSILPSTSYPELVCNMFRRATNYNEVTGAVAGHENSIGMNTSGVILLNAYVNGAYVTNMADVNALIPQEGCQITYKIKTPLTYQLDPIEIATLYGQNNVWANCGAVEVDYPADTGLYIDKRLSAIVAQIVNS